MSYVDAVLDKDTDRIIVVERTPDGKRLYQEYPANYVFYYVDPKGKYHSIYGDPLSRVSTRKRAEFEKEKRIHASKKLFESDINVVFRCLSENYAKIDAPQLHTCFFDIETAFDPESGFAPSADPFSPVTAITVYLDWLNQLVTLAISPKALSKESALQICNEFENCLLVEDEKELFETFFSLIEDADVLTGWNSEGYDIPYLVNRVTRVMSKNDTRKFCLLEQLPKPRKYVRYGKEETTYDLVGRVHLDYLQLYKKYNYESRHSYSLDAIGEYEECGSKTAYEGTLDQLYNQDFKTFIEYNRQDVLLMLKIHNKLTFLDLANVLAHQNTVLLPTVLGTVAMFEMGVLNEAHERGLIIPDKKQKQIHDDHAKKAAGAYVAVPKTGIHEWIGAVDLASLYPSAIRALNMAPETIIGQIRPTLTDHYLREKAKRIASEKKRAKDSDDITGSLLWEGLFGSLEYEAVMKQERGTMLTLDYEDGTSRELSAAEIWKFVFDSNHPFMLSANGTIFTYEREGVIPGLLTRWYVDRQEMQKKLKAASTPAEREYWDKRQLVRKINLNSAYGALLNEHCRFYDIRLGQSVTLTGRQIVKHMSGHINEIIAGSYDHIGEAIIYGDTDSCYFSAYPLLKADILSGKVEWNKDLVVQLYDNITEQVNDRFAVFAEQAFHTPRKNGEIIRASRELVGDRSLFITKKHYAVNIYDKEGKRLDVDGKRGKIKAMGLDLKRADTPKYVQKFLMEVLEMVLAGKSKDEIVDKIKEFKVVLSAQDSWTKGTPKSVNNLTTYGDKEAKSVTGRANMPGHVRAALNWNYLRRAYGDRYSMRILDGMKIIVCKLRANPMGFTSIAYPVDELRLPPWFTALSFDDAEMERTLVDEKIENLLGVLNWDLRTSTITNSTFHDLFSFT